MTNKKMVLGTLAVVLVFGAVLTGCGQGAKLIGTYTVSNDEGDESFLRTIEFVDNTIVKVGLGMMGYLVENTGEYKVSGNKVTITVDGSLLLFEIMENGKRLKSNDSSGLMNDDALFVKE
jgi:hypothetical protein